MKQQLDVFTIERATRNQGLSDARSSDAERHREIMQALSAIMRRLDAGGAAAEPAPAAEPPAIRNAPDRVPSGEIRKELSAIEAAIEMTRRELAGLHREGGPDAPLHGVTDELDEVVRGTERATNAILESTEMIESDARNLAAALRREGDRNMAYEIQEQATRIFEACNFQDLTGQRITRVVSTLRFVEERVLRMIEIWGGLEGLGEAEAEAPGEPERGTALHGPGNHETDPERASQDDIDAIFS